MSSAVVRMSAALLSILLLSTISKTQIEAPSERVWFAVEERPRGQLLMEPFAIVREGQLFRVPSSCSESDSGIEPFASRYLQPGQTYSVIFGGSEAGQARVLSRHPNTTVTEIAYEGSLKLRGQVRALATNQPQQQFRPESRQAATKEDRTAALALAREIFQLHGVPEHQLSKVHADLLTRSVLAPSPLSSWIGSFTLETSSEDYLQHNLFFVAAQGPSKLESELIWIRLSKSADEDEAAQFVDHADLLSDGHDEIVVRLTSTQNHRFAVYQKNRDGAHWEQIFLTEPLECF